MGVVIPYIQTMWTKSKMKRKVKNLKTDAKNNRGFTLIELLIVIVIISLLMSILLPALVAVKKTARSTICQSNIRSTGFAFDVYGQSNNAYFPPAYTYIGGNFNNQPEQPIYGICHWSGILIEGHYVTENTLHCPEIPNGGLAPQNTLASNLDSGQETGLEDTIDIQANRCAFTVNEALCPRNRFTADFEGTQNPSKLVKQSQVDGLSRTILLTEWPNNWQIVSGSESNLSFSYLPVHGFRGLGKMTGSDRYDLNMVSMDLNNPCNMYGNFRRINEYDLSDDPGKYRSYPPRLDWVGRNHKGTKTNKNLSAMIVFVSFLGMPKD